MAGFVINIRTVFTYFTITKCDIYMNYFKLSSTFFAFERSLSGGNMTGSSEVLSLYFSTFFALEMLLSGGNMTGLSKV